MRAPVIFATQSASVTDTAQGTGERLVNLYADPRDGALWLRSHPALGGAIVTLPAAVVAVHVMEGVIYAVAGGALWSISGGSAAKVGDLLPGDSATMDDDGTNLAIVTAGRYWVYDGSTLDQVTGGAFNRFSSVSYIDGYMLLTERDGGRVQQSNLLDPKTLDASKFATAESRPDPVLRGIALNRELWLFGSRSLEIYYNAGSSGFAFARREELPDVGCMDARTIAQLRQTVFWVSQDGVVYQGVGFTPQRISTPAIEEIIAGATVAGSAAYSHDGRGFYALIFSDRPALVFDPQTGLWSERSTGVDLGRWCATSAAWDGADGSYVVGCSDGAVRRLSGRSDDMAAGGYMRLARSRPMRQGGDRFTVVSAEAHMETGRGDIGRDPSVDLSTSKDGERWSAPRSRSLGAKGGYRKQVRWNALGSFRDFSAELRVTDPVDVTIFGASVEIESNAY